MAYIGKSPSAGVRQRYYFTATGGETSISGTDDNGKTLIFSDGEYIDVYLNGVLLVAGTDYVTTTANTIGSLASLAASDIVEVVAYDIFSVADTVSASAGGTFSANVAINGDLTVDTNSLYVDSANNRIGIGTTTPDRNIHITDAEPSIVLENSGQGTDLKTWRMYSNSSSLQIGTVDDAFASGQNALEIGRDNTDNITSIQFKTGASSERMRIDSSGNVGIGTTSPEDFGSGHRTLQVEGNSTNGGIVKVCTTSDAEEMIMYVDSSGGTVNVISNDPLMFRTNNTERMRIDASGNLLIGKTTATGGSSVVGIDLRPDGILNVARDGSRPVIFNRKTSTGQLVEFKYNDTTVGSIDVASSSTSYNTSSDYRLKENVTEVTGAADRVKALNPVRFNFIADPDTTVDGFLAHEVQDIVPEAITGTKDAVDNEGNPVYQGIDQSKLVPLLTAALQEALTKIDDLESRLSALETA